MGRIVDQTRQIRGNLNVGERLARDASLAFASAWGQPDLEFSGRVWASSGTAGASRGSCASAQRPSGTPSARGIRARSRVSGVPVNPQAIALVAFDFRDLSQCRSSRSSRSLLLEDSMKASWRPFLACRRKVGRRFAPASRTCPGWCLRGCCPSQRLHASGFTVSSFCLIPTA